MLRAIYSPEALEDLDKISLWIAQHDTMAALRWLEEIDQVTSLLATHPGVGEAVPQYGVGVRRWTQGRYLVLFRPTEDRVDIVRVLHGSRDIDTLLG